jgi:hypothetical protein
MSHPIQAATCLKQGAQTQTIALILQDQRGTILFFWRGIQAGLIVGTEIAYPQTIGADLAAREQSDLPSPHKGFSNAFVSKSRVTRLCSLR